MLDTFIDKGIEPVKWLLVIGIAYSFATMIWTFFDAPIATPTSALPNPDAARQPQRPATNVNWILSKHLFGEAGSAPVVAATDEPAVQTRLPLELRMVVVADIPEDSSAMVAQRGKPGQLYTVGETLPGNAQLTEVHRDRIILRRAGVRETLMFPKTKGQFQARAIDEGDPPTTDVATATQSRPPAATATQSPTPEGATEPGSSQDVVADYKERLANDAAGTLDELGIESVDSGGYRIGDSAQSSYLRQTGLQPGDVILSVNGRPVGNIQQDQLEIENILAQGSARIEVQRGSRRFFITASLN